MNGYQYVGGNSVGWVDPLGLASLPKSPRQVGTYKGVEFSDNIAYHLRNFDGYDKKDRGIKGAHNKAEFEKAMADNGLYSVSERAHPSIPGIHEIEYGRASYNGRGELVGEKIFDNPKTVYDSSIISDEKMFEWGREAAVLGYQDTIKSGSRIYTSYYQGIKFRIYIHKETGKVTNFHPSMHKVD